MAIPNDISNTMRLIRDFWPDLQFQRDDLLRGNPDFNKLFYVYLINDLNDKVSCLINEENSGDYFDDLNYDDEVKLYCKVANVFKRMQQNSFCLMDFYTPAGKKMYPLVKFSIHFIIYVNNCWDEISVIVNDLLKKLVDCENYRLLEQQLLEEYAEIAENLALAHDSSERLLQKSEEVRANYLKMLEGKSNDERNSAQHTLEIKELQSEVDYLEYELKLLEENENQLQEAVISETEFEHLKETENCLEVELRQLHSDSYGTWDYEKDVEYAKRYEKFAKYLTDLDLDSLNVHDLQKIRQDAVQNENIVKINQEELISCNNIASDRKMKLDLLKQTLEETQAFRAELKTKFTIEEREEKESCFLVTEISVVNFEENQRQETLKVQMQEDMNNLEKDECKLNTTVAQHYNRILKLDNEATTKFNNMLLDLKNRYV